MEKEHRERAKKAMQEIEDIKQLTVTYEAEKSKAIEELAKLKYTFSSEVTDLFTIQSLSLT